jgi:hypothetical protein
MLLDYYKEFYLKEKVMIKREIINNFLLGINDVSYFSNEQISILNYVVKYENSLTISSIIIEYPFINEPKFSFIECIGILLYGQFIKPFPPIFILNKFDFSGV